ncbi:MAG: acyl-CoA thioesterase [Candidatus Lloydbacteria bacterium CG22_combo_CG10-13_8_21_14_all_47_15]|uniref:Acyl-CoA thioesterase n=1 Tax=Candidatus Lloydbacteria bacterium CG22_combo_CG10-13_8_21_14_all_47_15 TaxID=1974635 RepID=A0A2H0CUJ5_9BACT|nr:MAG: acyl-CoA thioesterase [Candidatus Lloydbacteria bacterium CG22_combo_CG10-13_8_21_14_all_47_15]
MKYRSRRIVQPKDLNVSGTLFGGRLLEWIDEECAIYAICQLGTPLVTTKFMSEIDFIMPAQNGDILEIGVETAAIGRTSFTMRCLVRNKTTKHKIVAIERIVYVALDEEGKPTPHGVTAKKPPKH